MPSELPTCLVIDGHPLVRIGVRRILEDGFEVHESHSREEALDLVRDVGDFDVAVLDMRRHSNGAQPSISGPEAIRALLRSAPALGVVAYGDRAERHSASAALQAGAAAFVARTAGIEALRLAVEAAAAQETYVDPDVPPKGSRGKLTRRQREILQLLADGESTTVAARELDLSEETVKTHTKNALARLNARNRTHAVAIALRESLVDYTAVCKCRAVGALVVVVAVQLSVPGLYLPPVLRKLSASSMPPQMIISLPLQTAVKLYRAVGALPVVVAIQLSVLGVYLPPVLVKATPLRPPQMIISVPVHTALWPSRASGGAAVAVQVLSTHPPPCGVFGSL